MGRDLDFSDDPKKQEAFEKIDFDRLHRECCETEAACLRLESPVVFNHNDLLSGNCLVPHEVCCGLWQPVTAPSIVFCLSSAVLLCQSSVYGSLRNKALCIRRLQSPHGRPEWAMSCICVHTHDNIRGFEHLQTLMVLSKRPACGRFAGPD